MKWWSGIFPVLYEVIDAKINNYYVTSNTYKEIPRWEDFILLNNPKSENKRLSNNEGASIL